VSIDRVEAARRVATRRGLRLIERGDVLQLRDGDTVVHRGGIADTESFLAAHPRRRAGGKPKPECAAPPAWAPIIDDYLVSQSAVGMRAATIELRRFTVRRIVRGLGCPPEAVTSELLVDWFGQQTHWALETRRTSRAYRGTRNLRAVQVLLGHQSIATTERYCAVNDSEIRAAMESASRE
jgi:hypothetical protein